MNLEKDFNPRKCNQTLSSFSSSLKTPAKKSFSRTRETWKTHLVLYAAYALSVNAILAISMSALQVLIAILSPKFIWSEISQFRGKTRQQKSIGSAGNCFSGSEVLLQPQDRFGKSAICHDQSEERLTYLFPHKN